MSPEPERVREALAWIRATKPPPVEWLVGLVKHENRGIREWSVHAIGDLAPAEARIVDLMLEAFEDEDDYVRWKARARVGKSRSAFRTCAPKLEPTAQSEDEVEVVRATAVRAVRQIHEAIAAQAE